MCIVTSTVPYVIAPKVNAVIVIGTINAKVTLAWNIFLISISLLRAKANTANEIVYPNMKKKL